MSIRRGRQHGGSLGAGLLVWILAVGLQSAGCTGAAIQGATIRGPAPETRWPPVASENGRLVLFGNNWGWEGLLGGVTWKPELAVDGSVIQHENGSGIILYVDLSPGRHRLTVDNADAIEVDIEAGHLTFVEMQRAFLNKEILPEYRLRLLQVNASYATTRTGTMKEVSARLVPRP